MAKEISESNNDIEKSVEQLDKEIMRRKLEEDEFYNMSEKGLPNGMGSSVERANGWPEEVKNQQEDFNQKQGEYDTLRADLEETSYQIRKRTEQQPLEKIDDVPEEWLRRSYEKDPELEVLQNHQREVVEEMEPLEKEIDQLRKEMKEKIRKFEQGS